MIIAEQIIIMFIVLVAIIFFPYDNNLHKLSHVIVEKLRPIEYVSTGLKRVYLSFFLQQQ
jgi:hypothetical protein